VPVVGYEAELAMSEGEISNVGRQNLRRKAQLYSKAGAKCRVVSPKLINFVCRIMQWRYFAILCVYAMTLCNMQWSLFCFVCRNMR
jgi:hypothetical protein